MSPPNAFNFVLEDSWALSSDRQDHSPNSDDDEVGDEAVAAQLAGKTMREIFAMNHPNLLTIVFSLMMTDRLVFVVSNAFLEPEEKYIETGEYNYAESGPVLIPKNRTYYICAVGCVEKVLLPALQILYACAGESNDVVRGDDYTVILDPVLHVKYKFNGHEVQMKIEDDGTQSRLTLYIDE